MRKIFLSAAMLLALGYFCCCLCGASLAQEEVWDTSFGMVKSVLGREIVVIEYDYDKGENAEVSYSIDKAVELNGVEALSEIEQGDDIEIDYVNQGGKRIAKVIFVDKKASPEIEDEYEPLQEYDEGQESLPEEIAY